MKVILSRLKACLLLAFKIFSDPFFVDRCPIVTMSTLHGWRYPFFLLISLTSVSAVGIHWRDVGLAFKILPLKAFVRKVRIASLLPSSRRGVLIYDPVNGRGIKSLRRIILETNYYCVENAPNVFILPYFAHPEFYRSGLFRSTRRLATKSGSRPLRLFFSGTVSQVYLRASRFNVITRLEMMNHVGALLKEDRFSDLRSKSEILTTTDIADNVQKHALSPSEFLRRLAETDFFLSPPGIRMPHAHNIIEGMSVGAIPITNYHEFMSPPLRHGIDCLAFDTLDELSKIIELVATIDEVAIERIREGVIQYYYRYLDPPAVGRALLTKMNLLDRIVVNGETGFELWNFNIEQRKPNQ
jgi:hypothetical protein